MAKKLKDNSIYFFRYKNPAGKGRLKVWDTAPLIIPLDITSKSLLAVNLHWIPNNQRADFVDFLLKYFAAARSGGKRYKRTKLYYSFIKSGRVKWALVAIRRYHLSRITNLQEVPKDMWDKVLGKRKFKAKFQYDSWVKNLTRGFRNPTKKKK